MRASFTVVRGQDEVGEDKDWRLQGQEQYLHGVSLVRRAYRHYPADPTWDHDHCAFCWTKLMVEDDRDVQREGYATTDDHHWICETCFQDFRERFCWSLVLAEGEAK